MNPVETNSDSPWAHRKAMRGRLRLVGPISLLSGQTCSSESKRAEKR